MHLAGWPQPPAADRDLLADIEQVRVVASLGHQARQSASLKVRQPLRRIVVEGATRVAAHADVIADELQVKEVEIGHVDAGLRVKPNLPLLGPRLGKELGAVRAALQSGEFEDLGGGRFRAAGHELEPDEVLVERAGKEGWALAADAGVTVALDTHVDEELAREARVNELNHLVNTMRKEAGLELTDRIRLTIPARDADLLEYADLIKAETLAVELSTDGGDAPAIARA